MQVIYNDKSIRNNELLNVNETQVKPKIVYHGENSKVYTLIMYDPDAINGTHIHWVITNIVGNNISTGTSVIPYKGPAPPPKTGKHRYIFELYEQPDLINVEMQERNMSVEDFRKFMGLNISDLLYKLQFISQNTSAGKKTRRATNKNSSKSKLTRRVKMVKRVKRDKRHKTHKKYLK